MVDQNENTETNPEIKSYLTKGRKLSDSVHEQIVFSAFMETLRKALANPSKGQRAWTHYILILIVIFANTINISGVCDHNNCNNIFWKLIDDTSSSLEHLAVWGGDPGYLVGNTDGISTYYSRRAIYAKIDKLALDNRKYLYILPMRTARMHICIKSQKFWALSFLMEL